LAARALPGEKRVRFWNRTRSSGLKESRDYKENRIIRQTAVIFLLILGLSTEVFASLELSGETCKLSWSQDQGIYDAASVQFEVSRTGSGAEIISVSCDPGEALALVFASNLTPYVDELGGYGSDLYAQLEFFRFASDDEAGSGLWLGWQNRYDLEALRLGTRDWDLVVGEASTDGIRLELTPLASSSGQLVLKYYMGARDRSQLRTLGIEDAVLFDIWAPFRALCLLIWAALDSLYAASGSWGMAILLLALLVRVVTIPITKISLDYQRKAAEQQARMAPKVKVLKESASGLELSEKMVALYETEGYDHLAPFKGMLGLFIQIPILIALFTVIGEMSVLREQQFLWITDLSLSDRLFQLGVDLPFFGGYFNLLPWLMALTTILSTWVASLSSEAEVSAGSLYGMALVFFVFSYSFPAALVLYWFASNFFQLLQQLAETLLKR